MPMAADSRPSFLLAELLLKLIGILIDGEPDVDLESDEADEYKAAEEGTGHPLTLLHTLLLLVLRTKASEALIAGAVLDHWDFPWLLELCLLAHEHGVGFLDNSLQDHN